MDKITNKPNLELQLLNSLLHEKILSLLKGKLDSQLLELVEKLCELMGKFRRLCQDYLEDKYKKVGKLFFREIKEVAKVIKRLQQKVYNICNDTDYEAVKKIQ